MQAKPTPKTIFSGIQPSGTLHIGNYLGAITQWVEMQDKYNCIFCVVDYHAITVPQNPKILRENIIQTAKIYLASGIDPAKSVIFQQSDITAHTELAWILNTITNNGDLAKMTQFKDKAKVDLDEYEVALLHLVEKDILYGEEAIHREITRLKLIKDKDEFIAKLRGVIKLARKTAFEAAHHFFKEHKERFNKVGVGIFDYPVLMAADILLYDTDAVPVGEDQAQHVELARNLARRFNRRFGETFKIPELIIREEGARIMGLDDPLKKMSKSAKSEYNYIALTDKPETAAKKIMKAVTDSGSEIIHDKTGKPAISNLMSIYSILWNMSLDEIEKKYRGKGYGEFKKDLAEIAASFLKDFQDKYRKISDTAVKDLLKRGALKIGPIAEKKMQTVKERVGIKI